MIGNMFPKEATHSSWKLFEKPARPVTSDGSVCQKVGPVYSPTDQCLILRLLKYKIVQASEDNWKHDADALAATDVSKTVAPYFCDKVLHSLFSDCTVSANGLKISKANGSYANKSFIETKFAHSKHAKATRLDCQDYSHEDNLEGIPTAEVSRQQILVRQSFECTYYGKVAVFFFTCD